MPRKTPPMKIEVVSGTLHPNLESAQSAALPSIAEDLVETLKRLLAEGWLISMNGRIVPNPEKMQHQ